MAVRVRETAGSESGTESYDTAEASIEMVTRSTSRSEQRNMLLCRTAVLNYLAANYGGGYVVEPGYPLRLEKLSRQFDDEGDCWNWTAEFNYKPPESTARWSFDTTGGTIRVTHSKQTRARYPGTGPNFNNAIGVANGEPQGVDIVIPALKLNVTYRWPKNTVTPSYANMLATMSGCVNSDTFGATTTPLFGGYAPGELLFLGATGEIVPAYRLKLTTNLPRRRMRRDCRSVQLPGSRNAGMITYGYYSKMTRTRRPSV